MLSASRAPTLSRVALILFLTAILDLTMLDNAHAALSPQLSQAVDKIYNADFGAANRLISSHITANPKDPAGFLLRGMMAEWDQSVNNKRRALNGQVQADYQKANDLAQADWEDDKDNVDKMVMLGNTHMYIAKKLVDNGQKMRGGFALKKAKELMLDAIAKQPDNTDAYMALGVFNYFSANVPSGFKWLASLMGFKGNEAKGIEYLKRAAENDGITRGDAGYLLVYVYEEKEANYATALQYNAMLKNRYPGNPAFQYETGELLFRQKKFAEARSAFDRFNAFCGKGNCNDKYLFLSHFYSVGCFVAEGKHDAAVKDLEFAFKLNDGQYPDRNVDLDLWAGLIAKKKGDKAKAEDYYKKVEANKDRNPSAWEIAKKELSTTGG